MDHTRGWVPKIDALELWCWERLLRVPWTARKSHQSIVKEISPEYSLEGLMLKLKLQYSGYLMRRIDSLEKTLMLGKIEDGRRRGQKRMGWLDGITDSMGMSLSKLHKLVTGPGTRLSNCTETNIPLCICTTTSFSQCVSRLLPCPSYCKQRCNEHWGTCIFKF